MNKAESSKRLHAIIRLYADGYSIRQIAERFALSRQAIHERLVRAGVTIRPRQIKKRQLNRDRLIQLYVIERLSVYRVAKELGTQMQIVLRELERHAIERRPKGTGNRRALELDRLTVGDSTVVYFTKYRTRYSAVYQSASLRNIKVSMRKIDANRLRVTRIG